MTEHDFRLQRAKILRELETAEHLGCKRVIADCKHRLQELEDEYKNEYSKEKRYIGPSFKEVMSDDALLPTMKFIVTFNNGEKTTMFAYKKPNVGLSREEIEKDFIDGFNAKKNRAGLMMIKAHYIPLRGGRKSNFELACQRIGERFEALRLAQRYRREEAIYNNS